MVPRENKNNAYAEIWGTNKENYGIFRKGLFYLFSPNSKHTKCTISRKIQDMFALGKET